MKINRHQRKRRVKNNKNGDFCSAGLMAKGWQTSQQNVGIRRQKAGIRRQKAGICCQKAGNAVKQYLFLLPEWRHYRGKRGFSPLIAGKLPAQDANVLHLRILQHLRKKIRPLTSEKRQKDGQDDGMTAGRRQYAVRMTTVKNRYYLFTRRGKNAILDAGITYKMG